MSNTNSLPSSDEANHSTPSVTHGNNVNSSSIPTKTVISKKSLTLEIRAWQNDHNVTSVIS